MNTAEILMLYDYNYWAGARIRQAALRVTPEQFLAKNSSSYGSLRGTLVHALFAETIWRRRLQGEEMPSGLPTEGDFPDVQSLYQAWADEEGRMRAYLNKLDEDALQAIAHYKSTKGVPYQNVTWQVLAHVLNHGTQHRAEAAAMLTDFGYSPGDIDMILYLREKGL